MMRMLLFLLISFLLFLNDLSGQDKLKSTSCIPILAWGGVPPNEASITRYQELKYAGIMYNLTRSTSPDSMERTLDLALKSGIKLIVRCPELELEPEKITKRFMNHPATGGYFICDEPSANDFPELGNRVKRIRAIDNERFCYLNLFPNYALDVQLGAKTYQEYVKGFINEVPVQILSFDNYPILESPSGRHLRENWFENLEVFSSEAKLAGKPFWAFALTVSHGNYPVPTLGELRLQVFSNLAYGAQGIQYFTYWTPLRKTEWNYQHGPISDITKQRTEVYDKMKFINNEIQNLAGVFLGAKVLTVEHTGIVIPQGTKRMTKLPSVIRKIETDGNGAIVSILEKGNEHFLVIVNRDFQNSMKLTIEAEPSLRKILKDGTIVPANAYLNTMEIEPGDISVYSWSKTPL
jgi:hypothetical protein